MSALDRAERVEIRSRAQWRAWLTAHHGQDEGVWCVRYRQHVPDRHVPYDAVVEEALCFGWIDSLRRKLDADRTLLFVSPRRAGSPWSRLNKARLVKLDVEGALTRAGWASVEQAKADGSWSVYDDIEDLVVPPDLAAALEAVPGARAGYEGLSDTTKKGLLWWIKCAKRPSTRRKRVRLAAGRAADGKVANQ